MCFLSRKRPAEKLTVKRVRNYIFQDRKMIRTFGLFITVKNRATGRITMEDFIDNYSTNKHVLDGFVEKLFRLAPYQIQDLVDDVKRERELDEMELPLGKDSLRKT